MNSKEKILAGLIRRCLSQRYLLRSRNRDVFPSLLQYHEALSRYFETMGTRLIINDTLGIAYLDTDPELDEEIDYQLGRTRRLQPLETIALIKLRSKRMEFFSGSITSEIPVIGRTELREYLKDFLPALDERAFEHKFSATLTHLIQHRLLQETEGEYFEVTPVVDILLPADAIHTLLERSKEYFA